MGKVQFFEMRAEQMTALYDSTFTKKDAIKTGENLVKNALEAGEVDPMELLANLVRLEQVISSAVTTFRNHIVDEPKQTVLGVEFTPTNGGNTINYSDDPIYCELKKDLDSRVELLKLAQKQEVLDTYGNEVPKVSTTPRKSSITIKF
jgi:hypothetical protein